MGDLRSPRKAALSLARAGRESGGGEAPRAADEGETLDSSLGALKKLQAAGIKRSAMTLAGLGGAQRSSERAAESARLAAASAPEPLSALTTSFPRGVDRVQAGCSGARQQLTAREGAEELRALLARAGAAASRAALRPGRAPSCLALKGRLGRDKEKLLKQPGVALSAPRGQGAVSPRPERARGSRGPPSQ